MPLNNIQTYQLLSILNDIKHFIRINVAAQSPSPNGTTVQTGVSVAAVSWS